MRRREFLGVLGGAAAAWPTFALGQEKLPRVGLLLPGTPASHGGYVPTFLKGLEQFGLINERNVALDLRYAEGRLDRIPSLVGEFVNNGVSVLVAGSTRAGIVAKQATASIPIVFVSGDDPINVGLVASLNRPGGNVTGISLFATELIGKRLELLFQLAPTATAVGILVNPANPNTEPDKKAALGALNKLGRKLIVVNAATDNDLDTVFAALDQQQAKILLVQSDPFMNSRRDTIVALAARHGIAGNYPLREYVVAGGLMSYGVNFGDSYRQAGTLAGQILKGAKPTDLPVLQPTKFELVINLKTAQALGITLPSVILSIADEVIE